MTNAPLDMGALVADIDTALFEAPLDVDPPEGDSQKSIKPFSLNLPTRYELTQQPSKYETAYLADMAKVETLEAMSER